MEAEEYSGQVPLIQLILTVSKLSNLSEFSVSLFANWRRQWQPTPVLLPGKSQGLESLLGCRLWGCTDQTRLKRLSSSICRHVNNYSNYLIGKL